MDPVELTSKARVYPTPISSEDMTLATKSDLNKVKEELEQIKQTLEKIMDTLYGYFEEKP